MKPEMIFGKCHEDNRGLLFYNNDFDLSHIKRMYIIENISPDFVRSWKGHKIEQRWFCAVHGSITIQCVKIENWEIPNPIAQKIEFKLTANSFDILQVPPGYVTSIQSNEINSRLLVMSDYHFGEVDDQYSFPLDYFKHKEC
jgi:hypothetical protein